jgi:hypothetical protein
MDLRPYIRNASQLESSIELIRSKHLFYQPFILADRVEVGEGQNLHDKYKDSSSVFDCNVYAPDHDLGERKQPADPAWFRHCNEEYRQLYTHVADQICARVEGPLSDCSIGEIGCNTGLNLFNLALRGAKACHGYDWNDMQPVFSWLNALLGTNVQFTRGVYDNLHHRFKEGVEVQEVDIMVNTVFTNHQCDPLQFLCYLCDRARKGVFLWALIHTEHPDTCILYPEAPPHEILQTDRPFPLYFNNGVLMSEKLLRIAFHCLGFEEVELLDQYAPSESWNQFTAGFRMYYARRTKDVRSAYWTGNMAP